jgi:hypothetical protein
MFSEFEIKVGVQAKKKQSSFPNKNFNILLLVPKIA